MITARSLAKKIVTLSDGTIIGTLYNILVDFRSGAILNLIVKPSRDVEGFDVENGFYVIPFTYVRSISDYIVVDRRK